MYVSKFQTSSKFLASCVAQYMKHIATIILEALIDQDATVRELDLMVIHGLLKDHVSFSYLDVGKSLSLLQEQ